MDHDAESTKKKSGEQITNMQKRIHSRELLITIHL